MAEPAVKHEDGVASPMEDDDLEDAGDVEFYDHQIPGDPFGSMYLTRIPAYVWQAWDTLEDDGEIELGRIRQWRAVDARGRPKDTLQLLLRADLAAHQALPREYNLDITDRDVRNAFVFSEQDLPSFAAKNKEREAALAQGIPSYLLRKQVQKKAAEQQAAGGQRVKKVYSGRRAIPKKTKIVGRIKHELSCTPVDNAETSHILTMRAFDAHKPKTGITLMQGLPPNGVLDDRHFASFIKTGEKPVSKAKKMENKTTRWSASELLDQIAKCFTEFNYWSLKALRSRIPQPEAFIRETLDGIAVLHRSGRFANHWSLKPEYRQTVLSARGLTAASGDSAAPAVAPDPAGEEEEEEEDMKMEDVL
ncbi:hypothetical protein P8C59_005668 [Phyllachora maydis]|uniref:Transcription initiation factor IIF subunit beta n=1 Tax=Phyllachora maydis TaxID=1825666 RepID=A0AAD9I4X2_9PEZI|nr:hypothetical protein P8C59_005668 [Phyllachora maydis]